MMTTYFIYSAMGYMGNEVSDIFAAFEMNAEAKEKLKGGIKKELGNIEIFLWDEKHNQWKLQNGYYETGPIAVNKQFIPLENIAENEQVKIKIVLNKGLWRIDYAALSAIVDKITPYKISAKRILNKGKEDAKALAEIRNPNTHLISMPGSEFKFQFEMPDADTDYELFLYSKGYYLEWMRAHWIQDKNFLKLNQMVNHPRMYLKTEAKNYKKYEATMEQEFWNSKIDTKIFSYYED